MAVNRMSRFGVKPETLRHSFFRVVLLTTANFIIPTSPRYHASEWEKNMKLTPSILSTGVYSSCVVISKTLKCVKMRNSTGWCPLKEIQNPELWGCAQVALREGSRSVCVEQHWHNRHLGNYFAHPKLEAQPSVFTIPSNPVLLQVTSGQAVCQCSWFNESQVKFLGYVWGFKLVHTCQCFKPLTSPSYSLISI